MQEKTMNLKGDLLGKRKETSGRGQRRTTESNGMNRSKYIICMYENVTIKPIILYIKYK
jgi:hypothetical protein